MLLRDKLRFPQELATHTQTKTRNNASQIRNRETNLNNLLQNSVQQQQVVHELI